MESYNFILHGHYGAHSNAYNIALTLKPAYATIVEFLKYCTEWATVVALICIPLYKLL